MFGLCLQHADWPTPQCKSLVFKFKLLMIPLTIVGILFIYFNQVFPSIFLFLQILMLYCSYATIDHFSCFLFILLSLCSMFNSVKEIGLIFQNNLPIIKKNDDIRNFLRFLDIFNIMLNMLSIYLAFQGYREFKGIKFDLINGELSDGGYSYGQREIDYQENRVAPQNNNENQNQQNTNEINRMVANNVEPNINIPNVIERNINENLNNQGANEANNTENELKIEMEKPIGYFLKIYIKKINVFF